MSGPQGSDPGQQWQPPGEGVDRSSEPTQVGQCSPWHAATAEPGRDLAGPGLHAVHRLPAVPAAG